MERISNRNASSYVHKKKEFQGNNTYGRWENTNIYAVYSYGTHFPIYVYDKSYDVWFGNKKKYSKTTSKHQTQLHPNEEVSDWMSTQDLQKIIKNAMDPKTKAPHPRQRIELAIEEAKINIDPFKPVREQVKIIIDQLKTIIPLSFDKIRISIKIPPEYVGKAYGIVRNFGVLEREDWQSDGSWIGIIKIPAGMQNDFYDKINDMTKGNVSTKILK